MIETALADPAFRRPGIYARLLLFLLSFAGFCAVLALAFPPGAPDRLPVLVLALLLALASAQKRDRGTAAFSFLFPCAGLLALVSGGTDPMAWPVLLFAGLAAGWSFRFLYDFESVPRPSRSDGLLRSLLAIWALAALLAVARAHTLWAALHGLAGRTVNREGLVSGAAVRESVLSFSALAAGAAFFFLLRRSEESVRRNSFVAAVSGVCLSAMAAVLQRLGVLPAEDRPFWKLTGRLAGGAADPNSLGLLCALALVVAAAVAARPGPKRAAALAAVPILGAGLVLSGSRSGFLIPLFGIAAFLLFRRVEARARLAAVAAAVALLGVAVLWIGGGSREGGTALQTRLGETFDSTLPLEYRVSARPLLWKSALMLFLRSPVEGEGLGTFSWRLPDVLAEQGRELPMRDNPGSAYVQALAETGLVGLAVTMLFALLLGREAARRLRAEGSGPALVGASAAVIAFLLALAIGSHWLATDVSLFFFLLAALVVLPPPRADTAWKRRLRLGAVLLYAAAAFVAILATAGPEVAFRHDPLIGFHGRETGPGGPFRWTRRNFAVWLPAGESRLLKLALYTPEGTPVTLEARTEGSAVFRRAFQPGEAVVLRLSAPRSEPRAIVFSLSRAFVPRRLGISKDRRELGLLAMTP